MTSDHDLRPVDHAHLEARLRLLEARIDLKFAELERRRLRRRSNLVFISLLVTTWALFIVALFT